MTEETVRVWTPNMRLFAPLYGDEFFEVILRLEKSGPELHFSYKGDRSASSRKNSYRVKTGTTDDEPLAVKYLSWEPGASILSVKQSKWNPIGPDDLLWTFEDSELLNPDVVLYLKDRDILLNFSRISSADISAYRNVSEKMAMWVNRHDAENFVHYSRKIARQIDEYIDFETREML